MEPLARLLDTWAGGRKASPVFAAADDDLLTISASAPPSLTPKTQDLASPMTITALLESESQGPEELFLPPLYESVRNPEASKANTFLIAKSPSLFNTPPTEAGAPTPSVFVPTLLGGPPQLSDVVSTGTSAPTSGFVSILTGTSPSLEHALQQGTSEEEEETDDEAEEEADEQETGM